MTDSRDRRDPESVSEIEIRAGIRAGLPARLRALDDIEPGDEVWARIQSRTTMPPAGGDHIVRGASRFRWHSRVVAPLAVAAGLLIAVMVGLLSVNAFNLKGSNGAVERSVSAADTALEALYRRSRELEPLVQGARYARSDSAERAFIYRIADVDSQLAGVEPGGMAPSRREVEKLWGQRVALLESLAEVRRARAVLRPAVY